MASPHDSETVNYSGPRQPPRPKGLAFILSLIVLVMYTVFVIMVGFAKPFLGTLIAPGLSWGILFGALVIIIAWLLTLVYVTASNKK